MSRTREASLLVAILSALAIWWVWSSVDPLPLVEDEYSYLLQSRIFASGHWTAPPPPIPEFFQQAHVLTAPAVASKFPPGHALLMSVGSFFDAPALVPILLTGLTGALLFVLALRVANPAVALLTCIIWLGDPINLRFRPGYFSEVTSGAMWIIALWALLRWRDTRHRAWLLAVAAAIGWGAITRPLTMLAFAVPVSVVVIRDVIRGRLWRDCVAAVALGTAILGVIPLWSARTTGNWRLTPLALYRRDYLPYDKPGFGVDSTPPALALMPVDKFTYSLFFDEHKNHTVLNLPRIAGERLSAIASDEWSGVRLVLVPFAVVGLFAMNADVAFALLCSLALFVGYLSYGHWAKWTLYYFEAMPVLSLLTALGLWRTGRWILRRWSPMASMFAPRWVPRPVVLVAALLSVLTGHELTLWRAERHRLVARDTAFHEMVNHLPVHAVVMFVQYAPRLGPHSLFVGNTLNAMDDPVWIVNDLGPRDEELMRFAGPRIPLLFHEESGQLEIDRALAPHSPDN